MSIVAEVPVVMKVLQVKPSVTGKEVFVSMITPFGNGRLDGYNKYYHILLANLEENRNRIIIKHGREIYPANDKSLALLLDVKAGSVKRIVEELCNANVIGQFIVGNRTEYYINPKFAFCGKEIPEFLMWMFHLKAEDLRAFDTLWIARQQELKCL
jgi:hypothetical protein